MVNTYQHTHDFAKHLQEIVDEGEFPLLLDTLCNQDNFPFIHEMPHLSRYKLVHDIAERVPLGQEKIFADADESMTFLLMSVPYEPLCSREKETAIAIAEMLKPYRNHRNDIDFATRDAFCQEVASVYAEMNGLDNRVSIGRFWMPDNATEEASKLYNRMTAIYTPSSSRDFSEKYGLEADVNPNARYNILIKGSDFENNSLMDTVASILHEIRHHQQDERGGVEIISQRESGLSQPLQFRAWNNAYFSLMEERQTFGYTEWIKQHLNSRANIPSEIQITYQNLSNNGMSPRTSESMLWFNYNYNRSEAKIPFTRSPAIDGTATPLLTNDDGKISPRPR